MITSCKLYLWQLAFILLAICPSFSYSQDTADGIVFDADDAIFEGYDKKNQIIKLTKSVKMIYQGQYVECDKASINTALSQIHCFGNVRMIGPQARLQAEEVTLNYKKNTGEIKNGFVQVGNVIFEGELIQKISEREYKTLRGYYTACSSCPAFWSFRGSEVDAEIEGYAYIKNATLYFGKVPSFWLPYLVVPLKSERQSGLLFPAYEISGSKGFTIEESFFWAMSDSQDSTWTAKYYTEKGMKGLLNYRYVLSEESRGEFNGAWMKDKTFSRSDEVLPYNLNQEVLERWFIKYNHMYSMPYDFVQRVKINAVSDTRYPKDFDEEIQGRGDSALENRISLTKNTDSSHTNMDASYYRSLLTENPLESNYKAVHRFPEINYNLMPQRVSQTNLLFDFGINYTNFTRDNASYDDRDALGAPLNTPDGTYDPDTDLIRTGQRLDVEPSLSYPVTFGTAASIIPSVSFRETRYQFAVNEDSTAYRRYLRANLNARTHVSSVYGDLTNPISVRFKHIIQPEIGYTNIPWNKQQKHAFFGEDEFDSNFKKDQPVNDTDQIQFDYKDRIYEKNLFTYSVTNKILRKRFSSNTAEYQQIFTHKLSQSYDVHEERRQGSTTDKQPWSEISSLLDIRLDYLDANSLVKYFPYQNAYAHATRLRIHDGKKEENLFAQITYSQDFLLTSGNSVDLNTKTEDLNFGAGFKFKYIAFLGNTTYNLISDKLQSFKYVVKLKPPGNCWSVGFQQEKLVDTETDYRFGISFLFDGKTETGLGGI